MAKDTLGSIISIEYQKRMKINFSKTPTNEAKFYALFMEGVANGDDPGIIIRLAEKYGITPCLIAKLILKKYYRDLEVEETVINNDVKTYLRDTTLITNMDLAYEVYLVKLNKIFHLMSIIFCILLHFRQPFMMIYTVLLRMQ